MTIEATHCIAKAYWALGDRFSRLGGAARYRSMSESDIPLFIGCELAKAISPEFAPDEYLQEELFEAAKSVLPDVKGYLGKVNSSSDEIAVLLSEFIAHVDGKYKPQHRSLRWEKFMA